MKLLWKAVWFWFLQAMCETSTCSLTMQALDIVHSKKIVIILVSIQWYLIVASICIFLRRNDVEYLFMCLFSTCISSLVKCLFKFCPFRKKLFGWILRVVYIFLKQVHAQLHDSQIFPLSKWLVFSFSAIRQMFWNLHDVQFSPFFFYELCFHYPNKDLFA